MALHRLKDTSLPIFRDVSVRSACFAFLLTRSIVFGVLMLASYVHSEGPGPAFGRPVEEITISVRTHDVFRGLSDMMETADGLWYMNIARSGYEKEAFNLNQQHTWAYFPLYPLLVSMAAKITGQFSLTAALLSNIFFLAALVLLHKTALQFGSDQGDADRTVFYIAAFPTSYFFSLPFTESLFLLLTVSSFYCAKREMWWRAGILGALTTATRLAGLFLLPALLILYWQRYRTRGLRTDLISFCLIPLGLVAYMIYLHSITGNALAFFDIQAAWGHRPNFFLRPLFDYMMSPLVLGAYWDFRLLNFSAVVLAFVCCGVLLMKRQWALGAYTLISLVVPLSATVTLQSLARYTTAIFPVFIALGPAGRSPRGDQAIRAIFLVLLGLLTAMYALRVSVALA